MMTTADTQAMPRGALLHPLDLPRVPPDPIELLLLEDSRFDAAALERDFRRSELEVSITVVEDIPSYRVAIAERRFDLVMLDYLVPGGDGLDACALLGGTTRNANVPRVMISNEVRHDMAVAALRSGCLDCLPKETLGPDMLRDLVLRATSARQRTMPGLLEDIRALLREELAAASLPVDISQVQMALSALGITAAQGRAPDWGAILQEEETAFVFRNHTH